MELISAYLDGELSQTEKIEVEKLLESSPELRSKLEELKKVKELINKVKTIPESPYFETRLMTEIESQKSGSEKSGKWILAAALVLITLGVMTALKINPNLINNIWEDQKTLLSGFYKENLKPVLFAANLTTDDIFNFAVNNELPLDNSRKQYLLLGYDDSGKEFFEIRTSDEKLKRESYNNFIAAMKLDEEQKEIVDSILVSYCEALESQLLVNDNNTVAINPNLWNYRKAIFADLLMTAEKLNDKEFYKVVPGGIDLNDRVKIVHAVERLKTSAANEYIFVTPDSVFTDSYEFIHEEHQIKILEVEKQIAVHEKEIEQFNLSIRYDTTLKHLSAEKRISTQFHISVDPNICRIDLPEHQIPDAQFPDIESINNMIEVATNNIHFYAYKVPKVEKSNTGIKFKYYDGDSVHSYEIEYGELNLDSIAAANHQLDLYRLDQLPPPEPFNDSMLAKYQFDKDYYYRYYSNEELKKEMEELQKEFHQFIKEMKDWRHEVHKEVTKSYKK